MSGTGFVTFKSLAGRACAVQTMVTNRPSVFVLAPAPEARDIIWKNVTKHVDQIAQRRRLVNMVLGVGILFWSALTTSLQALTTPENLAKV
ncbi:unnamed protein product, partial [Discosporangium mesarthrocarpum]